MSNRLADELTNVLDGEQFGLSCDQLALRLRRRRSDVLAVLRSDPRFEHDGRTCGSRWRMTTEPPLSASWDGTGRNVLPWDDPDPSGVPVLFRDPESGWRRSFGSE